MPFCKFYELDRDEIAENTPAAPDDLRIEALEQELAAAKEKEIQLESRIKGLRGGALRARQAERTAVKNQIKELEQKITQIAQERTAHETLIRKLEADKSRLEDELDGAKSKSTQDAAQIDSLNSKISSLQCELDTLKSGASAEVIPGQPLARAWRLLHLQEPTLAFVEAMRVLEYKLCQGMGHELEEEGRRPDLYQLLEMVAEQRWINQDQFSRMDLMRMERNKVVHPMLQGGSILPPLMLTEPQARINLSFLEQVIKQLGS